MSPMPESLVRVREAAWKEYGVSGINLETGEVDFEAGFDACYSALAERIADLEELLKKSNAKVKEFRRSMSANGQRTTERIAYLEARLKEELEK